MNRDEILAMSKQENRGQDVADLEVSKAGMQLGWIVCLCLLAAVSVADALVFGRLNSEIFFAVMAGSAAIFFFKYRRLRRRHELVIAAVYSVAALAFLVSWIIQLADR